MAVRGGVGRGEGILDVVLVLDRRGGALLPEPARKVVDVLRIAPGQDVIALVDDVADEDLVVGVRVGVGRTIAVGVDLVPVVGCLGRRVPVKFEGRRVSDVAQHPIWRELRDDGPQRADNDVEDECESYGERSEGMKPGLT